MDNAKLFLLKRIAGYKTNGHEKLGHLNAEFIEDISDIMNDFVNETFKEVIPLLNKGETVDINGLVISLKKSQKKHPKLF